MHPNIQAPFSYRSAKPAEVTCDDVHECKCINHSHQCALPFAVRRSKHIFLIHIDIPHSVFFPNPLMTGVSHSTSALSQFSFAPSGSRRFVSPGMKNEIDVFFSHFTICLVSSVTVRPVEFPCWLIITECMIVCKTTLSWNSHASPPSMTSLFTINEWFFSIYSCISYVDKCGGRQLLSL